MVPRFTVATLPAQQNTGARSHITTRSHRPRRISSTVRSPVERNFSHYRDGAGVNHLSDILPHESEADKYAPVFIHHHLRVSFIAVRG